MPDSSKSLEELKLLWESDPSSKVYLQLARAYREAGQIDEAIQVLETSLQHRPRDPRGRVALARCHIEAGRPQPAAELLEEVIRQDAAHIDANKLLLECYLRLGDEEKAEERLNIYRLLNDGDPELDHLQYRFESMGSGDGESEERASTEGASEESEDRVRDDEPPPVETAPEPPPVETAPEPPPVESAPEIPAMESAPEPPPVVTAPEIPPVETVEESDLVEVEEEDDEDEPETDENRDIFEPAPENEPEEETDSGDDLLFDLSTEPKEEAADELPLFELWEHTEAVHFEPEPEPEPKAEPEPEPETETEPEPIAEPVPEPLEPAAAEDTRASEDAREDESTTATLGHLYLRQGHYDEAEAIFREVLRRDPEHATALRGVDEVAAARAEATPSAPPSSEEEVAEAPEAELEPVEPEPVPATRLSEEPAEVDAAEPAQATSAGDGEGLDGRSLLSEVALSGAMPTDPTGRKIAVLQQYLKHLRSGEPDHVH